MIIFAYQVEMRQKSQADPLGGRRVSQAEGRTKRERSSKLSWLNLFYEKY